jgi:hypothetical protein
MKKVLSFFCCVVSVIFLHAQNETTTIHTDSSVIRILSKANEYKVSTERYNNSKLTHSISYYKDTLTIETDSYRKGGRYVGIHKIYNEKGKLRLYIDHDNSTWQADPDQYPYYPKFIQAKERADSILKIYFGNCFFQNYIRWDIFGSYFFGGHSSSPYFTVSWTRHDAWEYGEPTAFILSYEIIRNEEYSGDISLLIDANGTILKSHPKEPCQDSPCVSYNEGFQKFTNPETATMKLDKKGALKLAEGLGLNKSDTMYTDVYYHWESSTEPDSSLFNGHLRIYVSQSHPSDFHISGDFGFFAGDLDTWIFDAWSGEFIERKKISR